MTNTRDSNLGYDPELGYEQPDAGPAGPHLTEAEQAAIERTYRAVVDHTGYDPEERGKVIYAEFALGPDRGRKPDGPDAS